MKVLNKYESPKIEIAMFENDIITNSQIGPGGDAAGSGGVTDPFEQNRENIIHIFKN